MCQQALYVVSYLGRDRFVWAATAAEAREQAATPRPQTVLAIPIHNKAAIGNPHATPGSGTYLSSVGERAKGG